MNASPNAKRPFSPGDYASAVAAGFTSGQLSLKPVTEEEIRFIQKKIAGCERTERHREEMRKAKLAKKRTSGGAKSAGSQEHEEIMRAIGQPPESDGQEHGEIMREIGQ